MDSSRAGADLPKIRTGRSLSAEVRREAEGAGGVEVVFFFFFLRGLFFFLLSFCLLFFFFVGCFFLFFGCCVLLVFGCFGVSCLFFIGFWKLVGFGGSIKVFDV